MALHEFFCDACRHKFEQITSSHDPERGKCPKCGANDTRMLISRFAVGGRGDLRESTFHGCHDHDLDSADHNHQMSQSSEGSDSES